MKKIIKSHYVCCILVFVPIWVSQGCSEKTAIQLGRPLLILSKVPMMPLYLIVGRVIRFSGKKWMELLWMLSDKLR